MEFFMSQGSTQSTKSTVLFLQRPSCLAHGIYVVPLLKKRELQNMPSWHGVEAYRRILWNNRWCL